MNYKLKYITLLSCIFNSTSSLWAMDEWNPEGEAEKTYTVQLVGSIRLLGNGKASGAFELMEDGTDTHIPHAANNFDATVSGFEPDGDLPDFSALSPLDPLPENFNFGRSHKRVHYAFEYDGHHYEGEVLDTFSTSYPHHGEWESHPLTVDDQAQHHSRFDLLLKVRLEDNSPHTAQRVEKKLDHGDPVPLGDQQTGKLYYDGEKVFLRQYREFQWTPPRPPGQACTPYHLPVQQVEQVVPSHEGSKIVCVEPIPIAGERLADPIVGYKGDYDSPSSTLPQADQKGNLTAKYLIYSDGTDIFLPKITHELWQRNGWRVGFGIASYAQDQKLSFINSSVHIPQKGLYRLDSIEDRTNDRLETWERVGENPMSVQITAPTGVSSIPGMWCSYVAPLQF